MGFTKNTQFSRTRKPSKRALVGETPEEEAARLEREIAAHPVTQCEPGMIDPLRPGRVGAASLSFRFQSGWSPRA